MENAEFIKVLIVDDELLIRQGIKYLLDWEKEGFEVIGEAANGKEALQIIKTNQPHIVITDIVMPVLDGESLIKVIKREYPEIEIVVLSSFDQFEYVRSSFQNGVVDYILKPNLNSDELLEILHKITSTKIGKHTEELTESISSVKNIFANLLTGYDLKLTKSQFQELFPFEQFFLIGMVGSTTNNLPFKKMMTNWFHKESFCLYELKKEDKEKVYLINTDKEYLDTMKKGINKVYESMESLTNGIRWVFGKPYDSLDETKRMYEKTIKQMYNYLFYFPHMNVLIYDQLPEKKKLSKEFNLSIFLSILNHSFSKARNYFEAYVNELATQYDRDAFAFKSFLGNIIFNVTVFLGEKGYDEGELEEEQYQYFLQINEANHVVEAIGYVTEYFDKVALIMSHESTEQQNYMQQLLNYIHQHYNQSLSLTDLANKFHFNPTYLSTYFSKHLGEGFSEYVNRLRIEKAKELLKSTKTPIADVSHIVGYSDQSYFSKVFKKIVGLSPSSYRRKWNIGNE
ncbi:response regulator transcription factor [Fervidibacillus albus]|uniref:Response regulator transcription factor n=1 Tax=Fervidibacillus albus TaxID=2980026 RepID=A0A9E8LUY3_9BACI|nr:response regulator transcription factor [Fervidibacillus albus]WAA09279.1 response regulator transcription factor [Fervidibacillus albus]